VDTVRGDDLDPRRWRDLVGLGQVDGVTQQSRLALPDTRGEHLPVLEEEVGVLRLNPDHGPPMGRGLKGLPWLWTSLGREPRAGPAGLDADL